MWKRVCVDVESGEGGAKYMERKESKEVDK